MSSIQVYLDPQSGTLSPFWDLVIFDIFSKFCLWKLCKKSLKYLGILDQDAY